MDLASLLDEVREIPEYHRYGRVTGVSGLLLEIGGVPQSLAVGGRCEVVTRDNRRVPCEVVGFRDRRALVMPFSAVVSQACQYLATYEDMAELIRFGPYRKGSDAKVDEAIKYYPAVEKFLSQAREERAELGRGYAELQSILAALPTP